MDIMIKLPDDMFRLELLIYLTVQDIVNLDNACMNHEYRSQLLDKISGVILLGDKDKSINASLFKWLGMRQIYFTKMLIVVPDFNLTPSSIENDYIDQFRYTQHVFMEGLIRDDMAIFIISHCPCLISIDIGKSILFFSPQVTDHTLQSIAEHCTGLQSLSLSWCHEISDTGLITISLHCPNLQSFTVDFCRQISDVSIILISSHCTGLQSLNLDCYDKITDASIISISTLCTELQSLNLRSCYQITDASIISISTYCTGLQSLNLWNCNNLTDVSIISLSTYCTGLQSLHLDYCRKITDASIISISENCTGLKRLYVYETAITVASLRAIAKNCTQLQLLKTGGCFGHSSYELRHKFNSVSELRAVLLSKYPSLPI